MGMSFIICRFELDKRSSFLVEEGGELKPIETVEIRPVQGPVLQ